MGLAWSQRSTTGVMGIGISSGLLPTPFRWLGSIDKRGETDVKSLDNDSLALASDLLMLGPCRRRGLHALVMQQN